MLPERKKNAFFQNSRPLCIIHTTLVHFLHRRLFDDFVSLAQLFRNNHSTFQVDTFIVQLKEKLL